MQIHIVLYYPVLLLGRTLLILFVNDFFYGKCRKIGSKNTYEKTRGKQSTAEAIVTMAHMIADVHRQKALMLTTKTAEAHSVMNKRPVAAQAGMTTSSVHEQERRRQSGHLVSSRRQRARHLR